MRGLTEGFQLPLLPGRVPVGPSFVRSIAAVTLLAAAALLAGIAAVGIPDTHQLLGTILTVAVGLLAVVAAVPSLIDGAVRFPVAGIASLALGVTAAAAGGLSGLTGGIGILVAVVSIVAAVYHLAATEVVQARAAADVVPPSLG